MGVRGLAPWSWRIFWESGCQMSNFKTFQPSQCVILQYQGGGEGVRGLAPWSGEGVRGLAPWSWSTFWVSRCQMSNFKTLWSIKLHFASRWTKSEEIDVAFCFLKSKVVWLTLWTFVYQVLNFGLSSCTLVYQVASWSNKLHFGL